MNSSHKKIILWSLAVIVILISLVTVYLRQKKASTPPAHPPIDEQLKSIGQLQPLEPNEIFATTGQIKQISGDRTTLLVATTRGDKTVTLSSNTILQRETNNGRPSSPPPALSDRDTPPQTTQTVSTKDLQVGQGIKVESLTNISGLSTFTVNKLTIIY